METNRSQAISQLADLIVAVSRPHPVRVAVDGRSAAGMSTLGDELTASIEQRGCVAIRASIDDFYRLRVHQFSRRYRTRWHDGWNVGEIDQVDRIAPENAILILDGVFLLRPSLNGFWDGRIFVDIDAEQSLERGVERDTTLDDPAVRATKREQRSRVYRERYVPADEMYLREVDPMGLADITVDNRNLDAPRLIMRRRLS